MIKKIKIKYDNLTLFSKIRFVICGLALMITFVVLLTSITYYSYISKERLLQSSRVSTGSAVNTIDIAYTDILEHFVAICGTEEFASKLRILSNDEESYTFKKSLLQNELSALSRCNYTVNSALILSGDKETYYSLYRNSLNSSSSSFISNAELSDIDGITWLSERNSPFISSANVIPIVFPVTRSNYSYTEITKSTEEADGYIIILLDSAKLDYSLAISGSNNASEQFFIVTDYGITLNPTSNTHVQGILNDKDTTQFIKTFSSSAENISNIGNANYYLLASKLSKSGLILVNFVNRETLSSIFGTSGIIILITTILLILILLILSFLLARYITRPLNILVGVINKIGHEKYIEHVHFSSNDEMGQLFHAINSMHDTIQTQMELIKQEEAKKYLAEIKLLSEQINPHFLYNTLEYIQLEVLNENPQSASNMIQYLVEYLRIGLSYGDDLIPISNELRHVHSYIKIMNQRFSKSIIFMYQVAPGLEQTLILKTILQPLVENSIKHGFSIDGMGIPIVAPTIEIKFFSVSDMLHIEIVDNGGGFDVKETEKILYGEDDNRTVNRHVGLNNVYHRLSTYYKKENVSFELSSIPYYNNLILIKVPLMPRKEIY